MINLKTLTQSKANSLLQSVSHSTGIAEAQAMYGNKTFQEANQSSKAFAQWIAGIAQVVSAILASSYFYFKIALPSVPFQIEYVSTGIAVLLTGIALVVLEYLKRQIFTALAVSYFRSKARQVNFKLWLLPIAVMLTVISIYTSFEGAKIFVNQSDKSHLIANDYDTQLKNLESEERAFKNSISWKGKIDTYNRANAKILAGFEDRRSALHQEKNSKIDVHKVDIEGKGYSTAIFSLLMELLAIGAMGYVCYVNFYVFVESKTTSPTDSEHENMQVQKIGFSAVPNSTIAPQVNKVGFQFPLGNTVNVNNGERNTVNVVTLLPNERLCKLCGERFVYKHWNAQYCTEEHRIEAWEKKTGKKFNKKKGATK
jgi:cell division protein FtsL